MLLKSRSRSNDSHSWYAIDLVQADGVLVEVGVSSCPELEVRRPPPGHVVRVRVRRVDMLDVSAEYNVSICEYPVIYEVLRSKSFRPEIFTYTLFFLEHLLPPSNLNRKFKKIK